MPVTRRPNLAKRVRLEEKTLLGDKSTKRGRLLHLNKEIKELQDTLDILNEGLGIPDLEPDARENVLKTCRIIGRDITSKKREMLKIYNPKQYSKLFGHKK